MDGRAIAPANQYELMRKEVGGPAAAIANAEQLHARINRLREWASRQSG